MYQSRRVHLGRVADDAKGRLVRHDVDVLDGVRTFEGS